MKGKFIGNSLCLALIEQALLHHRLCRMEGNIVIITNVDTIPFYSEN